RSPNALPRSRLRSSNPTALQQNESLTAHSRNALRALLLDGRLAAGKSNKKGRLQASGPSLGRKRPRRAEVRDANHVSRCNKIHRSAQNARAGTEFSVNAPHPTAGCCVATTTIFTRLVSARAPFRKTRMRR